MDHSRRSRASRAQRGQSLVEVVVLAAALVPLLLAIPLLAKYQDIRQAAIAASRNAAFECSVRPDACGQPPAQAALADGLRRRHFARHDHDLLSDDAIADDAPAAQRNRFWVDRRGEALLADFSDVAVRVTVGESDALQGAWREGGANPAGPAAFGLDAANGMVTAQVRARVSLQRTLAQWLARPQGMALALTGKTAVIVDAWNASAGKDADPRSFQSRVELGRRLPGLGDAAGMLAAAGQAAPAGVLGTSAGAGPEELIDLLYSPIRFLITGPLLAPVEPRGRLFRYHEIDVDVVPQDRLPQEDVEGGGLPDREAGRS
jgi:hypothetical protein